MDVLLIRMPQMAGDKWLLPLNCATKGRRNCVVLNGPHRGSFMRVYSSHLDFVNEEDLRRGLTEWENKQQIRRQVSAYTEAEQPSKVSRVSEIESRRGPSEEHMVPSQRKRRRDMGQQEIGITPSGTSIREQLEYAIRKDKQMNKDSEHTAAEAILVSALDPIRTYIGMSSLRALRR
jgi:hypothetical protein